MRDLEHPLIFPHYERLVNFAKECGLNPTQLEKLSRLVLAVASARASAQMQKNQETKGPLYGGTGL